MIQAYVPAMAGNCWCRAARPVTKVSLDHPARGASPAHPAGGVSAVKPPQQSCRGNSTRHVIALFHFCPMEHQGRS
jgi:hypothetical protein